jgi:hypothetical protein
VCCDIDPHMAPLRWHTVSQVTGCNSGSGSNCWQVLEAKLSLQASVWQQGLCGCTVGHMCSIWVVGWWIVGLLCAVACWCVGVAALQGPPGRTFVYAQEFCGLRFCSGLDKIKCKQTSGNW